MLWDKDESETHKRPLEAASATPKEMGTKRVKIWADVPVTPITPRSDTRVGEELPLAARRTHRVLSPCERCWRKNLQCEVDSGKAKCNACTGSHQSCSFFVRFSTTTPAQLGSLPVIDPRTFSDPFPLTPRSAPRRQAVRQKPKPYPKQSKTPSRQPRSAPADTHPPDGNPFLDRASNLASRPFPLDTAEPHPKPAETIAPVTQQATFAPMNDETNLFLDPAPRQHSEKLDLKLFDERIARAVDAAAKRLQSEFETQLREARLQMQREFSDFKRKLQIETDAAHARSRPNFL